LNSLEFQRFMDPRLHGGDRVNGPSPQGRVTRACVIANAVKQSRNVQPSPVSFPRRRESREPLNSLEFQRFMDPRLHGGERVNGPSPQACVARASVIENAMKQSRKMRVQHRHGLPRRVAPRNDGFWGPPYTVIWRLRSEHPSPNIIQ